MAFSSLSEVNFNFYICIKQLVFLTYPVQTGVCDGGKKIQRSGKIPTGKSQGLWKVRVQSTWAQSNSCLLQSNSVIIYLTSTTEKSSMSFNTQRRLSVGHSHKAIRAVSLLNKPVPSFHMRLSLGELLLLLTNTRWKVLHALHLSLLSTCQCEHPLKPRQEVLNPLMHYSNSYTEICLGKACSFLVWRKINHNLLSFIRFTSQSYSKIPICPTTDKSTGTLKKIITSWYFIAENKSNSKTIKFKLWGVENPKIF